VTHWSSRLLADQLGISHSTVARVWAEHDVKPWQTEASGSPATRSWRPESATWSGCPWSRRRRRSCWVWTRSRRSRRWSAPSLPAPHPRRCPPSTSAWSSDSPGPVAGVADDRLGGGAAGLSTPQEVTPVKRSWTAVRPPVPRVAGPLAAVNDRGFLGAVNVLVTVHMVGAGRVEPPSSSAPANYREPLRGRPLFAGRARP
jgi:hypothetical protein